MDSSKSFWHLVLGAAVLPIAIFAQPTLDAHKLSVRSYLDFGHIVNGWNEYGNAEKKDRGISMLPLNRVNVIVIQDVAVKRFDVSVGLSGLIWWPYDGGQSEDLKNKLMNVKPLIPVARGRWQFGNPASLAGFLQVGTFSYKYNPDAKNLGEYLYRSGTYPGFLWTNDGWLLMNRAGNYSHGLLLGLSQWNGMLKHNFSLFMETQYFPVGDFSPGYDFSFTSKWFDFGAGGVLNHYLASKPSMLTPKNQQNTYVRVRDTVRNGSGVLDTLVYFAPKSDLPGLNLSSPLDTTIDHRWTFKGIKLMGRMAVNLGNVIPESMRGPEDLRVFAEAAILGLENQPLYYEKLSDRVPIMFGINLPTGRILDLLSLQAEIYHSPYNDIEIFNAQSLPIWKTTFSRDSLGNLRTDARGRVIPKSIDGDDFKWSVHAKKSIGKVMTAYAQAGSDHFRLTNGDFKVSSVPLTVKPSDWYYLFRLEFTLR